MDRKENFQDRFLHLCYTHMIGRILLRPLVARPFSEFMGKVLDSKWSTFIIPGYQKLMKIDMSEVAPKKYHSFNEFFTRQLVEGSRPICDEKEQFPSPCDGWATVYPITDKQRFRVKHTSYDVAELLNSHQLAKKYEGGTAIVLRLTVSDYHRYIYSVTGSKTKNRRIQGVYHTVNPIANDYEKIYKTNTREYTMIRSSIYGDVIQMEVGALCVGRILNYDEAKNVKCGEEKGRFEFGGSTIILLLQKGRIKIREDICRESKLGKETYIRLGQPLGRPGGEHEIL